MRFSGTALALALMMTGTTALAENQIGFFHEKVVESITIQADPAKVWALVSDFEGVAHWNSTVAKSTAIDEDREYLTRAVTYKEDIGKEVDVLDDRSDAEMSLHYHVTANPWPVSRYTVSMRVTKGAVPGTSVVEWRGAFDVKGILAGGDDNRERSGPNPGPIVFGLDIQTSNDSAYTTRTYVRDTRTVKLISDLYRAGLDSLKWVVER